FEFREAEADVVREPARIEIDSCRLHGCVVHVLERSKGIRNETANHAVLLKRKSVDQFDGWLRLPVELPYRLQVPQRRVVIAVKGIEGGGEHLRCLQVLVGALQAAEKEQLVLQDWPSKARSKLLTIERHGDQALLGRNAVAPPVEKSFAMDIVCARACHDVDRAGGCQLRR